MLKYNDSSLKKEYNLYKSNKERIERFGVTKVPCKYQWQKARLGWLCKKCGKIFYCTIPNMVRSPGCRECAKQDSSLGEEEVEYILKERGILFDRQKIFEYMLLGVNRGKLRFDYYIYGKNNRNFLIEIDGYQHKVLSSDEALYYECDDVSIQILASHDDEKNKYCAKNNIPLYRIDYNGVEVDLEKDVLKVLEQEGLLDE